MAITKVINDLTDLNQSDSTNALKGCNGTEAQRPPSTSLVDYVIVAGGGAGGSNGAGATDGLGGGGAGGYLTGTNSIVYSGKPTMISVGKGGVGVQPNPPTSHPRGINGSDSGFNGLRAIGGGGGSAGTDPVGMDGGSGGGGGRNGGAAGDSLNSQGNAGGAGGSGSPYWNSTGGGGGGYNVAGGVGATSSSGNGGAGGNGVDISAFINSSNANLAQIGDVISTSVYVAGGGGGGAYSGTKGTGGDGGGGAGGQSGTNGEIGTPNTGGGGGGDGNGQATGGAGGSGVVILKYDTTEVSGYSYNSGDTYTINWPADKYGVAYWPLNGNPNDVGGNFNGTVTDITYIGGKFNQAASFNGSTSFVEFAHNHFIDSEYTVSAWINTDNATSASNQTIWGNTGYDLGLTFQGVIFHVNNTALRVQQYPVGTTSSTATGLITSNTWYHVALSYNSTESKIYLNGELVLTASVTGPGYITSYPMTPSIGAYVLDGYSPRVWEFFDGAIEQVRLYASILSLTDIQNIYNNSKPGSLPLLKTSSDVTIDEPSFPSGATAVALYEFQGNGNSTGSASNNQTTVGTLSYPNGKFGEVASGFSASNYFATSGLVGTLLGTTDAKSFTMSAWIKTSTTGSEQHIAGNSPGSSTSGAAMYIGTGGELYFNVSAGGSNGGNGAAGGPYAYTAQVVADNNWHHVAVTYISDGTTAPSTTAGLLGLFVDGINVTSSATFKQSGSAWTNGTANPWSTWGDNYFRVGRFDGTSHFSGEIDQLRIYQSVLTDAQIYDLWQKENEIQTHFTSGSTDTLVFKSGEGNITFTNVDEPGAEIGMVRYNSTTDKMEHFSSSGWGEFTLNGGIKDYPIDALAFWRFNGNTTCDPTTYNPGTVSNITYGLGKFGGQSIIFNGTTGSGGSTVTDISSSITTPLRNSGQFTVSAWVNPATLTVASIGYGTVITFLDNIYLSLRLYPSGIMKTIIVEETAVYPEAVAVVPIKANEWTHVCTTGSAADGLKIYINGTDATSPGPSPSPAWNGTFATYSSPYYQYNNIGSIKCNNCFGSSIFPYDPHGTWNGSIDHLRIFDRSLTADQVLKLYREIYLP